MSLLESIIKGLECCTSHGDMCGSDCNGFYMYDENQNIIKEHEYRSQCPYGKCKTGCVITLAKDALTLLKALERDQGMIFTK